MVNPRARKASKGIAVTRKRKRTVDIESPTQISINSETLHNRHDTIAASENHNAQSQSAHICDVCNRAYGARTDMERHEEEAHIKNKRFRCRGCGKDLTPRPGVVFDHLWRQKGGEECRNIARADGCRVSAREPPAAGADPWTVEHVKEDSQSNAEMAAKIAVLEKEKSELLNKIQELEAELKYSKVRGGNKDVFLKTGNRAYRTPTPSAYAQCARDIPSRGHMAPQDELDSSTFGFTQDELYSLEESREPVAGENNPGEKPVERSVAPALCVDVKGNPTEERAESLGNIGSDDESNEAANPHSFQNQLADWLQAQDESASPAGSTARTVSWFEGKRDSYEVGERVNDGRIRTESPRLLSTITYDDLHTGPPDRMMRAYDKYFSPVLQEETPKRGRHRLQG